MNDENTLEVAAEEEVVTDAEVVEEAPVDGEGNLIPEAVEDAPAPEPEDEVPPAPLQVGL